MKNGKTFKLVGILVTIILALVGGWGAYVNSQISETSRQVQKIDGRVIGLERIQVMIQATLERIEGKVDRLGEALVELRSTIARRE